MAEIDESETACSLPEGAAELQLDEWKALREHILAVEALPDGRVMRFPAGMADQVRALAARESECCSFLRIAVHEEPEQAAVAVTITSENPEAMAVIQLLAGESED
ncbi:MAG: hypothetical protein VCC00_09885 [Deltaproteobacteria bacterium]